MRKNQLLKIALSLTCVMALLAVVISGCAGEPAPPPPEKPEVITLETVTSFPFVAPKPGDPPKSFEPAFEWADKVQERSKGELVFKHLGGPEVIPGYDQVEALRAGVIDIAFAPAEYIQDIVPGVGAFVVTRQSPMEMRESGFYDALNEAFQKHGVFLLGSVKTPLDSFMLYSNVKVETPYDLNGLTFRLDPTVKAFSEALGIAYVALPMGDVYTSLDRGLVDGFAWAISGTVVSQGWPEVAKYYIDHPFGTVNLVTFISLDAWEKLPNHLQDIMVETQIEVEKVWHPRWMTAGKEWLEVYQEKGMQPIRFSPDDAEWYVDQFYETGWREVLKKSPDLGARLRVLALY